VAGGGTGIGLKNVRERLRLIYGERATLSVVANAPAGVAATLTLPAVTAASSVEAEAVAT
jgi:sensor histidine kinase YesM